jgi:hypothetical protein
VVLRLAVLGAFVLAFAVACGEEKDKEQAAKPCGPFVGMMAGKPKLLPEGFPTPNGVTYTSEKSAGPSKIVNGYVKRDVDSAFESYKQALDGGGYTVTKDEHEEVDAEVNFSGGNSTGQVKLVQECRDRTSVTITARPA